MRNPIIGAGLLWLYCAVSPAQQQPPAPPPQNQNPAQANPREVNAKPDNTAPDDIDNVFVSLKGYYWLTSGTFSMTSGKKAVGPGASTLPTLGDSNKHAVGGMLTFPAGKYNRLEVSFFQVHGSGTSTAPENLFIFGQNIPSGDFLTSSFRIRTLNVTWNYLTWPAPPENSRFRLKTLWGFQWSSVQSVIDAPYETSATFNPAVGTLNIYYPTFGVEGEYILAKNVYLDGRISAFAWPHHAVIWDAEGNLVARYKFVEIFGGYKASHLKTSPQGEEYVAGTLQGAYGGLRLVFH
jgi:hypothetical protein